MPTSFQPTSTSAGRSTGDSCNAFGNPVAVDLDSCRQGTSSSRATGNPPEMSVKTWNTDLQDAWVDEFDSDSSDKVIVTPPLSPEQCAEEGNEVPDLPRIVQFGHRHGGQRFGKTSGSTMPTTFAVGDNHHSADTCKQGELAQWQGNDIERREREAKLRERQAEEREREAKLRERQAEERAREAKLRQRQAEEREREAKLRERQAEERAREAKLRQRQAG
jgi:hypothetical protein